METTSSSLLISCILFHTTDLNCLLQMVLFLLVYALATSRGSRPIYVSLGGSNTLGAKHVTSAVKGKHKSFAFMFRATLDKKHNYMHLPGGVGAMGPTLAAACHHRFVPPAARLATVEYIPNMGYTGDDAAELAAIETLLSALHARGARVIMVNIVPGSERFVATNKHIKCTGVESGCTTRAKVERFHREMKRMAADYGAQTIEIDADANRSLFGTDAMHLTQEAHGGVYKRLMELYHTWPATPASANATHRRPSGEMGVSCYLGDQLQPLVASGSTRGFARTDLDGGRRGPDEAKIAWEARDRGSQLTLCPRLPREASLALAARNLTYVNKQRSANPSVYLTALGLQISHPKNLPLYGVAQLRCDGACRCKCIRSAHGAFTSNCSFDGLQRAGSATVTAFVRMEARETDDAEGVSARLCGEPGRCVLRVANTRAAANEAAPSGGTITNGPNSAPATSQETQTRHRVVVRALIIGIKDWRTRWVNEFMLQKAGLREAQT